MRTADIGSTTPDVCGRSPMRFGPVFYRIPPRSSNASERKQSSP